MNLAIQTNWNNIVKEEDTVYLLGDYLFKRSMPGWHLNGNIILIRGNHDRGLSDTQLKEKYCISQVHKKPIVIEHAGEKIRLMHAPVESYPDHINLCGHVHDSWKYSNGFYNVGVDVHDFKPILLDYAIEQYKYYFGGGK